MNARSNPWLLAISLSAVTAAAALLRLYGLADPPIWFDEAFTWRMTQYPTIEVIERAARDNNPPLFYLLLKCWIAAFGESELALRLPAAVCGILTVVGVFLCLREAAGANLEHETQSAGASPDEVGLWGAAFTCVSVLQIYWSRQARMYSLGTALLALASWSLFRALHARQRAWPWWCAFSALDVLFLYVHSYAIFSVASQFLFLLIYVASPKRWLAIRRFASPGQDCTISLSEFRSITERKYSRRQSWAIVSAISVVSLGWLAWVPFMVSQHAQVKRTFWIPPVSLQTVAETCYKCFSTPEASRVSDFDVPGALAWLAAALHLTGWIVLFCRRRAGEAFSVALSAGPMVMAVAISWVDTPILHVRYLIFGHIFTLCSLAFLVTAIPVRWMRIVAGIGVLGNLCLPLEPLWTYADRAASRPGEREAARFIDQNRRPQAVAITSHTLMFLPLVYYSNHRNDWRIVGSLEQQPHYFGIASINANDFLKADALRDYSCPEIWTVDGRRAFSKHIDQHGLRPEEWTLTLTEVFPALHGRDSEVIVRRFMRTHSQ